MQLGMKSHPIATSFVILYETTVVLTTVVEFFLLCLVMRTIALTKIWNRNEFCYERYSVVSIEQWDS